MVRRRIIVIVLGIAAAAFALVLWFPVNRPAAVTKLLDKGTAAIEREDLETLDKLISLYYKDDLGFTYASMRGNFSYLFREFDSIRISRSDREIVVGKDTCTARVGLWIRGDWLGKHSDMVGTERVHEPVDIYCVKEFFRWKVIGTQWPDRQGSVLNSFQ